MIAKFSRHFLVIGLSVLCACTGQNPIPSDNTNGIGQGAKSAGLLSGVPIITAIAINGIQSVRKKRKPRTTQTEVEETIQTEFASIEEIQKKLEPGKEVFFVDSSVDTIITCQQGTKILLPANTFSNEPGRLDVCVQEFYSKTDYLSKKLSTVSDGKILESAGSVKIDVYKGQEQVDVMEGEAYSILFPKNAYGEMQTFYGKPDENGVMNWKLDSAQAPIMEVKELIEEERVKVIMADSRPLLFRKNKWKFKNEERNMIHYFNEEFNGLSSRSVRYNEYMNVYDWVNNRRDYWLGARVYYDADGKVEDVKFTTISYSGRKYHDRIRDFMTSLPPLDMETVSLTHKYDHRRKCNLICFAVHVELDKDKYKTSFKSKYEVYEDKVIKEIPRAELDYFIQASTEVGWINCDRFPAKKRDQVKLQVASSTSQETQFFLIFEDMNAMVCGNNTGPAKCSFPNAPKGEQVKLVGISFRGDQPVMCIRQMAIDKSNIVLNDFQPFSVNELEEAIN